MFRCCVCSFSWLRCLINIPILINTNNGICFQCCILNDLLIESESPSNCPPNGHMSYKTKCIATPKFRCKRRWSEISVCCWQIKHTLLSDDQMTEIAIAASIRVLCLCPGFFWTEFCCFLCLFPLNPERVCSFCWLCCVIHMWLYYIISSTGSSPGCLDTPAFQDRQNPPSWPPGSPRPPGPGPGLV